MSYGPLVYNANCFMITPMKVLRFVKVITSLLVIRDLNSNILGRLYNRLSRYFLFWVLKTVHSSKNEIRRREN